MSIGAIASIVNTASAADRTNQGAGPPPVVGQGVGESEIPPPQDAAVTILSGAARAQQEAEESLRAAAADALAALQDQAARQQEAVDDAAAAAEQQRGVALLYAINAEFRRAFGALPSPLTGDPVLRDPGEVDVLA